MMRWNSLWTFLRLVNYYNSIVDDPTELFITPEECGPILEEELENIKSIFSGALTGVQIARKNKSEQA